MSGTQDFRRFVYLLVVFIMSMFFLVFSGNFFTIMVGWDGLGFVSFCLVVFYSSSSSLCSGLLTVFINRVGDSFFLVCFYFFWVGGFFSTCLVLGTGVGAAIAAVFFVGCSTKSAQLPFSAWLPAAIAAPTPVSSLVHSSTLVAAGVYLMVRFNFIFFYVGHYVILISLATMLLAGISALMEADFKKVVAMSTLSQLGFMVFTICLGLWKLSFLHMRLHSFFKSMLFLSAGFLIFRYGGFQDFRVCLGGGFSGWCFVFFITRSLCLSGFPFLLGFYSKDTILSSLPSVGGFLLSFVFFLSCIVTVLYSVRVVSMLFLGHVGSLVASYNEESDFFFFPSLVLLTFCSLGGGCFFWYFLSDCYFFVRLVDCLIGVVVMLLFPLFLYLAVGFFSHSFFCSIGFSSIVAGGGLTFFMKENFGWFEDLSWFELFGGRGVFRGLFVLGDFFTFGHSLLSKMFFFSFPFLVLTLTFPLSYRLNMVLKIPEFLGVPVGLSFLIFLSVESTMFLELIFLEVARLAGVGLEVLCLLPLTEHFNFLRVVHLLCYMIIYYFLAS